MQREVDLVVGPAGGSQRLPRMVGITLAKELIFTGGITETPTCCYRHRLLIVQRVLFISLSLFLSLALPLRPSVIR